jgi:ribosome recycling factor
MAASIMAGIPALKELNADLKRRMDQAVASFQTNLASTRTGRASVHMLDQVKVDYYGTLTPINQLAQVSSPEAQMILIAPWDPTVLKEIEKAVRSSDLRRQTAACACAAHDRGAAGRGLQAHQSGA